MSGQLDYADLELLYGVERLHQLGGASAIYAVLAELGMARMVRTDIEILIRRHLDKLKRGEKKHALRSCRGRA
jgi:hypothetical protein